MPLPVDGDGRNVRDWLYVEDHVSAVWRVGKRGGTGETYSNGGDNEWDQELQRSAQGFRKLKRENLLDPAGEKK